MTKAVRHTMTGIALALALVPPCARAAVSESIVQYSNECLTVRLHDADLSSVLGDIARQSGAIVRGAIAHHRTTSTSFDCKPVPEALAHLLSPGSFMLQYSASGRLYSIDVLGLSDRLAQPELSPAEEVRGYGASGSTREPAERPQAAIGPSTVGDFAARRPPSSGERRERVDVDQGGAESAPVEADELLAALGVQADTVEPEEKGPMLLSMGIPEESLPADAFLFHLTSAGPMSEDDEQAADSEETAGEAQ